MDKPFMGRAVEPFAAEVVFENLNFRVVRWYDADCGKEAFSLEQACGVDSMGQTLWMTGRPIDPRQATQLILELLKRDPEGRPVWLAAVAA